MSTDLIVRPTSPADDVEVLAELGAPTRTERVITALIVGLPLVAAVLGVVYFWGRGVGLRDVLLATTLYFVVGHGMTVGFHRLLAHKSFVAGRPLKLALVALGSMAFEGGPIGWVADHRRHHVFADSPGDPHSPRHGGSGVVGQVKGLFHAHVGWLFTHQRTSWERHAADLLADRGMRIMNSLFPLWCVVSLGLPFGLGWLLGGSLGTALSALLWAGLVRVFVLHHVTWSVNSLCHTFGRRPFTTNDDSTNLGVLAALSMGESWHNGHHAFPRSARHGLLAHQWDTSAWVIATLARLGWVRDVRTPTPAIIRSRSGGGPSGLHR